MKAPNRVALMQRRRILHLLAAVVLTLTGCATSPGPREWAGMGLGGVLGGVTGSQFGSGRGRTAATAAGTLGGIWVGGAVGRSMDASDRARTVQALNSAAGGTPTEWRKEHSGQVYTVIPVRTHQTNTAPCRHYHVDGGLPQRHQTSSGTACGRPEGNWYSSGM